MSRVGDNLTIIGPTHDHAATECLAFWPDTPVRVIRWGTICHTDLTVGPGTITCGLSPYAAAGTTARAVAGTATYSAAAHEAGVIHYVEPTTEILCKPGDKLDLLVTGAWTAGDFFAFLHYQKLNWDIAGDNATFSDAVRTFGKLVDASV